MDVDGELEEFLKQSESDPTKVYPPAKKTYPQTPTPEKVTVESALAEILNDAPPKYLTPLDIPPNPSREIVQVQMPPPPSPRENQQGRISRQHHNFRRGQ